MGWTRRANASSRRQHTPDMLREIAEQCADTVWAQLPDDIARLDAAELRGYARALAVAVAREQLAVAADQLDLPELRAFKPLSETVERTVHLVLHRQLIDLQASRARRSAA